MMWFWVSATFPDIGAHDSRLRSPTFKVASTAKVRIKSVFDILAQLKKKWLWRDCSRGCSKPQCARGPHHQAEDNLPASLKITATQPERRLSGPVELLTKLLTKEWPQVTRQEAQSGTKSIYLPTTTTRHAIEPNSNRTYKYTSVVLTFWYMVWRPVPSIEEETKLSKSNSLNTSSGNPVQN